MKRAGVVFAGVACLVVTACGQSEAPAAAAPEMASAPAAVAEAPAGLPALSCADGWGEDHAELVA